MTIIRSAAEIATASTRDLIETYNAMTGNEIKKFETRAIAERRVEMALLAAADAAGHAGVPKGENPQPKTVEELKPFPEGSLSAKLASEVEVQQPITPRPKKAPVAKQPRFVIDKVRATFAGTSKCQAGSVRAAVLQAVQDAPDHTITTAELDKMFGHPTRGYLQKLLEKNHIVVVKEES